MHFRAHLHICTICIIMTGFSLSYCTMSHNIYIQVYIDEGPCIVKSLQHPYVQAIHTTHVHACTHVHILMNTCTWSPLPHTPNIPAHYHQLTLVVGMYHTSQHLALTLTLTLTHHQLPLSKGPHAHRHILKVFTCDWLFWYA